MLELEKLNEQTFDQIVEMAVKSIGRFDTPWNNLQASDPGMTLVDLFAWLKAVQQEYMSVIVPESQRRFLALLGIRQRRIRGARAFVGISGCQEDLELPAETKFTAGDMIFENPVSAFLFAARLTGVSFHGGGTDERAAPSRMDGNRVFSVFPGAGTDSGRKPDGEMILWFDRALPPDRALSLWFDVAEDARRVPVRRGETFYPMASVVWEVLTAQSWTETEVLKDGTCAFLFSGVVQLRHGGVMAEGEHGFALRVRLVEDGYDLPPRIRGVIGNVVEVAQQDTLVRCDVFEPGQPVELGGSDLGRHGQHRYFVERDGAWEEAEPSPADRALAVSWSERMARGIVLGSAAGYFGQEFPVDGKTTCYDSFRLMAGRRNRDGRVLFQEWEKQEDLYSCGPDSQCFVLDTEREVIRFGNHEQGQIPPRGNDNLLLMGLKTCRGKASNLKAGRIRAIRSPEPMLSALTVYQITPATGGRDEERFEETLTRSVEAVRTGERAVTEADYLSAVRSAPGLIVENCRVLTGFDGADDHRITVVVQGAGRARTAPLRAYEKNLRAVLDRRRMLNAQVQVVWPRTVGLAVRGRIAVAPYYHSAEKQIRQRIQEFISELNQTFGSVFSYGGLYCAVELLECVTRIESLSVEPVGGFLSRTRTDDIVVPPNSIYELKGLDLSFTSGL